MGTRDVPTKFAVEVLPDAFSSRVGTVDFLPSFKELVMDLGVVSNIAVLVMGVGYGVRWGSVIGSRVSKRPPTIVFVPIPLGEQSLVASPLDPSACRYAF